MSFFRRKPSDSNGDSSGELDPVLETRLRSLISQLEGLHVPDRNITLANEFEAWTFQAGPEIGLQHLVDDLHDNDVAISRVLADEITSLANEFELTTGPLWRPLDSLVVTHD